MTLHMIALIPLIGRSNGSPRWGRRTIKMSRNFHSLPFVCESSYTAGLRSSVWSERVLQTQLPTAALEGRWGDPWFWKHQDLHGCREELNCYNFSSALHVHVYQMHTPHTHTHAKYIDTCDKEKRWEAAVFLNYWVSRHGLGRVRNMTINTWIL